MSLLGWQSMLALFLASFIGPGQVSPDLANNALSLYLARPFSRVEYVLGKMIRAGDSAVADDLGAGPAAVRPRKATWKAGSWMADHARIASGLFFGAWIWILMLALLALALSAWVKWKPAAGAPDVRRLFRGRRRSAPPINGVQRTNWGNLFNISYLVGSVWVQLFEGADPTTNGAVFFRVPQGEELPLWCVLGGAGRAVR